MFQREWRTPEVHEPLNQLNRAHMGSQTLKQKAFGLHGSALGHLHMLWLLA